MVALTVSQTRNILSQVDRIIERMTFYQLKTCTASHVSRDEIITVKLAFDGYIVSVSIGGQIIALNVPVAMLDVALAGLQATYQNIVVRNRSAFGQLLNQSLVYKEGKS